MHHQIYFIVIKKTKTAIYAKKNLIIENDLLIYYRRRPIRNITARSYSATTLKQINNENGINMIISMAENSKANISTQSDMMPSAENRKTFENNQLHYFGLKIEEKISYFLQ